MWEVVKSIPVPTLLLYGSHSNVVTPELAEQMRTTMPNCIVERVERAGHGLFTDQPEVFADSVGRFLGAR
jgi:pimeloyl-ACP methyl ester carboxylesterase